MKFTFVSVVITSIVGLCLTQANAPSGGATNTGANSGSAGSGGTNGANTGTNNKANDGSQGFNQGYSYNTGIRPYQTGFTFYQPFGEDANKQNTPTQTTGGNTGAVAAPQAAPPAAPAGYQPGYNVFSAPQTGGSPAPVSGQPVQYQNGPQFVHYGPPPPQGAQIQPIQLNNFDAGGIPLFDTLGLGGNAQNNNNNRRTSNNNNQIPINLGGDFDIPVLGGGGGNRNNGGNVFFTPPNNNNNDFGFPAASNGGGGGGGGGFFEPSNNNNNNGYDNLPDDQSLANFANLGGGGSGGGGQSNDYPDNDFGNLGDFGSATQNRGTFDVIPNLGDGFFRRK